MGALIRAIDWSQTAARARSNRGRPALRMMVRFLLANRFPLLLWWGPQYVSIYNDRVPAGARQRSTRGRLGQPVSECWSEIWHILQPLIDTPFNGGPATWNEDILLEINRHGFVEETHFTIAYSPVPDDTVPSGIGGVLATVHEITEKVVGERRVVALRDLGARVGDAKTAEEACAIAARTLAAHGKDVPFVLLYLIDADGTQRAPGRGGRCRDGRRTSAPLTVDLRDAARRSAGRCAEARRTEAMQVVERLRRALCPRCRAARGPIHRTPPSSLPIPSNKPHQPAGLIVAGVSARLKFDEYYRDFFELVRTQIATAIANARAYRGGAESGPRRWPSSTAPRPRSSRNVSHEFRTPLTLMLGPVEDMPRATARHARAASTASALALVHRNGLRLLKLVNTLLDFSRIEAGRVAGRPMSRPIWPRSPPTSRAASAPAIEQAGPAARRRLPAARRAGRTSTATCGRRSSSTCSRTRFKFTFEGEIAVSPAAGKRIAIELEVRDTGTGIPAAELPHVFERFHRVRGRAEPHARGHRASASRWCRSWSGCTAARCARESADRRGHRRSPCRVPLGNGAPAGRAHRRGARRRLDRARRPALSSRRRCAGCPDAMVAAADGPAADADLSPRFRREPAATRSLCGRRQRRHARVPAAGCSAARYEVEAVADGEAALAAARARRARSACSPT